MRDFPPWVGKRPDSRRRDCRSVNELNHTCCAARTNYHWSIRFDHAGFRVTADHVCAIRFWLHGDNAGAKRQKVFRVQPDVRTHVENKVPGATNWRVKAPFLALGFAVQKLFQLAELKVLALEADLLGEPWCGRSSPGR